ncbi:peroxisomal bifunctional enzyme [Gadus macrocephalus]|uniref:peroxisomal bifunctional enzyme n=1 Tax=Gadus macrocephalus TaxID=80720 RepID=UPI0028CBBC09|nr:peroxisomal bifunctional enzyme [Gadus macrocephalus]
MAQYRIVSGSVAVISIQNPPVNALSAAVREGLLLSVRAAASDPLVRSVVISGHNGPFCGGADIKEFGNVSHLESGPHLVEIFESVEALAKPVVAAIEGFALGGGLELALACHYRFGHSEARVGLPEVSLGLLPGAGGSQRLPRLLGVRAALDMIVTGRHVAAGEALKLGLLDRLTDGNTVDAAVRFAQSVEGKPLDDRRVGNRPCPPLENIDAFFEEALIHARGRARGAAAPLACVQAVRGAATLPFLKGMELEKRLMETLMTSGQAQASRYCFFTERGAARWTTPTGARWDTCRARPISTAAVIGLGTMGRGITVALARAGLSVVAVETQEHQLDEAQRAVSRMLKGGGGVSYSADLQAAAGADLVVEAVFEDMAVKEEIFKQLSSVCKPGALLASNTSSLDIDRLASCTLRPEQVLGMHFFAPAHVMRLLEVVSGPRTSPQTVAAAMQLGRRMGKVSVAVGNCPGFVGNRMLKPYLEQASFLLEEGASPELVDAALEEFGFPMGVFKMSDLSGLDIGWRVRKEEGLTGPGVTADQPMRTRRGRRYSPLGDLMCEEGRYGQKTGRGWYLYDRPGGRVARSDPWLRSFLEEYRARHGLLARRIDQQEVLERCLYALINEGFRVLEDGVAASPQNIDAIYVFGYGWPKHRGGPMFYAAQVGLARVLEGLEKYHKAHPDSPHLQPCSLLRRLVASGSPPIHKWSEVVKGHRSQL